MTVLVFYPDTSHNLQSVIRWNALVQQFAGKPIQFAWITGEQESSLLPWLQQHPVNGWVFYDPEGSTGRAYGMDIDAAVIIGADRIETEAEQAGNRRRGVPGLGVGDNAVITRAILDKDSRVGSNVQIINRGNVDNAEGAHYVIRDGIVVIPNGAVVPEGTVI